MINIRSMVLSAFLLSSSVAMATEVSKQADAAKRAEVAQLAKRAQQAQVIDTDTDSQLLEAVSRLPLAKTHRFIPQKVMDGGSALHMIKGYFDTPKGKTYAVMFVTPDLGTALYGQAFDTNTVKRYSPVDTEELKSASVYTIGDGPDEFFLVSDPLCPYCMSLEKRLAEYADKATFHLLFISLPMHPRAPEAIAYILSKEGDEARHAAAVEIAKGSKSFVGTDKKPAAREMARIERLAGELNTQGTPSLFSMDGEPVPMRVFDYYDKQAGKTPAGR